MPRPRCASPHAAGAAPEAAAPAAHAALLVFHPGERERLSEGAPALAIAVAGGFVTGTGSAHRVARAPTTAPSSRRRWTPLGARDLTTTWTGEGQAAVFVALDHCSAECVGLHAALRATRFEALEPSLRRPRQCREPARACGAAWRLRRRHGPGLAVRHDHGSQYVSHDFQRELASSASRARPPSSARPRATAAPSGSSAR
jgi:transposase InsO family protein